MTNAQIAKGMQDIREWLGEVYNEHDEMKKQIRELRVLAGLEKAPETPENPAPGQ